MIKHISENKHLDHKMNYEIVTELRILQMKYFRLM